MHRCIWTVFSKLQSCSSVASSGASHVQCNLLWWSNRSDPAGMCVYASLCMYVCMYIYPFIWCDQVSWSHGACVLAWACARVSMYDGDLRICISICICGVHKRGSEREFALAQNTIYPLPPNTILYFCVQIQTRALAQQLRKCQYFTQGSAYSTCIQTRTTYTHTVHACRYEVHACRQVLHTAMQAHGHFMHANKHYIQ